MKFVKISVILFVLLMIAVGGWGLKIYRDAGEFKDINPETPKDCRFIGGVLGSEDITVDRRSGTAFISSHDFRVVNIGGQIPRGAVLAYNLNAPDPKLVDLTADFKPEFRPHGLGLYTAPDGKVSLFVVNHRSDGQFIEIFDYLNGKLIHRQSISSALMTSPNDVIPVGPDQFYVTNDHGAASALGRFLEDFLEIPKAYVLYYNGKDFQTVAEGLSYANGINISPDGRLIYVAETIGRQVDVYSRDQVSGRLTLLDTLDLGTGVDNIDVDPDGNLWIGAHPKLLTFYRYSKDQSLRSPSQVLKVTIMPGKGFLVVDEYLSDGGLLSGASVGVPYEDRLLIGSVFDDGFLICRLPHKAYGNK